VWTGSNYRQVDGADGRSWYRDASGGTSLTVTAATSGSLYRISALTALAVPTLASSNIGVMWDFLNTATSNLSVTLTGTTNIASPITIYPSGTYTIRWTGSNYIGTQDKDAPANPATWAASPAIQTVDMSLNSLSNVGSNRFARVTGTFKPTDIAGCALWYDIADPSGVDVSGAGFVFRLRDKTGSNFDASLGSGQPLVPYGLPIGGRPVLGFPLGSNPSVFTTPSVTGFNSNVRSVFWVGRFPSYNWGNPGNVATIGPLDAGISNLASFIRRDNANNWYNWTDLGGRGPLHANQIIENSIPGPIGRTFLIAQTVDLSGSGYRETSYNGLDASLTGSSIYQFTTSDVYRLGSSNFGLSLGEVMVYRRQIVGEERKKVEGYLAWKWGIDLPSNHPYFAAPPTGSGVASNEIQAIASADRYNNLSLVGSNTVFAGLLEYREPNQDVGATYAVTAGETGTVYRMGSLGSFSNITLPTTLTIADTGVFWRFINTGTSNLSVTLTGTTNIASPVAVYPGATYTIRWTGSRYVGTQDKDAPSVAATDSFMLAWFGGQTYSSVDGTTWVAGSGSFSQYGGRRPVWNGTMWQVPGDGAWYSQNGLNWVRWTGSGATAAAWNGRVWVMLINGTMMVSTDGYTWSNASGPGNTALNGGDPRQTLWDGTKFITPVTKSGATDTYAYSYDGRFWYGSGILAPFTSTSFMWTITWNGSIYVAGGTPGLVSSPDGITWTTRVSGTVTSPVEWGGGQFMAILSGSIYTSLDGVSWTQRTHGVLASPRYVAWNGNAWYGTGLNSAGTSNAIAKSVDNGVTWTLVSTFPGTGGDGGIAARIVSTLPALPTRTALDPQMLVVNEISGTSLTLSSSNTSRSFYLTNSGFNALSLPSTTGRIEGGNYWSLRNSTASQMTITLTNTLNLTSPLIIPSSNTQTLVVSRDTSNTILLL
jgi:hypothetical protein